jgi:Family of unknown function (DUF6492)
MESGAQQHGADDCNPVLVQNQDPQWAVVTPSYRGDFERCRLLCQSMDAFVTGDWHHYVIVEKSDLLLFKTLRGPKRSLIEMESLLPFWMHHLTSLSFINNRSIWFSFRTGFMIGWQIQQLVKMEMAFRVKEAGLLYCDSDVFFVRNFDVSQLTNNGRFRFFRTDTQFMRELSPNPTYMVAAAKQLGLGKDPFPCPSYIDNMITWHSPTVRALCEHIEVSSGKNWKAALGRRYIISEYSLYGLYVDRIIGDNSALYPTNESICKTAWHGETMSTDQLNEYCSNLYPSQYAVGFQSFLGFSVEDLSLQLQRAIKRESEVVSA